MSVKTVMVVFILLCSEISYQPRRMEPEGAMEAVATLQFKKKAPNLTLKKKGLSLKKKNLFVYIRPLYMQNF